MKTMLVQSPNMQRKGKWKKQGVYRTPSNLAMLASYVREHGHEVGIIDLDIAGGTLEEMASSIMLSDPRVAGFTCLTPRFPIILDIVRECKKLNPDVIVILGGPHVSGREKGHLFQDGLVDYAMAGEGEEAFLEFLDTVKGGGDPAGLANIISFRNGRMQENPPRPYIQDLDALPFPAWDLLDLQKYTDPAFYRGAHVGTMSARGCPFDCSFCASKAVWGKKVRFRSPANIAEEIGQVIDTYGITEFMIYDDTFTLNRKRTLALCNEIIDRKLGIRYYAQVRADTIDLELIQKLKESGCFAVAIGVESGDDAILADLGKSLTKRQIREGCRMLKEGEMPFLASYIIGHPGDTHETIQTTINFANELDADQAKFLIATPYPGTKLFDLAVEKGILGAEGADDLGEHTYFQHVAANLSRVSDEELLQYQQKAFDDYDKRKRPLVKDLH